MRRPRPGSWIALGLTLALIATSTTFAQAPPSDSNALARYVPEEDLGFLLQFDGLDAHAEAWKKTVAYKILNDTPAGAMIEDVLTQWVDKTRGNGREVMGLVKHVARAGFVVAVGFKPGADKPVYSLIVIRGGYSDKSVRPIVARLLGSMADPKSKPQAVVRAGHKVISGKSNTEGVSYSWWVEETKKEDVVYVAPTPEAADLILETLDGKRPNATKHPLLADISQTADGFEPVGLAILNPKAMDSGQLARLGLADATRIDVRWGFQGDALQTIARIATPAPRQGWLSVFDGPTFDKGTLPPLPSTVTGFGAASFDTKATFDQVLSVIASASPESAERLNATLDTLQGKGRFRLRDDILGQLGPRMALYALPPRASDATSAAPPAFSALMMATGMAQVPRGVAVFEVKDSVAFGKALDELMLAVNRELKTYLAPPKDPAAEPGAPSRGRGPAAPTPEFRMGFGTPKTYNFSVPPELSKAYPPSFRPSIRLGEKHLVIAVTPDAAREALEAKEMWSPPAEIAGVFGSLPSKLKILQVADNRAAIAATLASFPARIQILANSPLVRSQESDAADSSSKPNATGTEGAGQPAEATPSAGGDKKAPAGPPQIILQVAPASLPSADAIRGMLFPSILAADADDREVRLTSRVAFPDLSVLNFVPAASLAGRATGAGGSAPSEAQPATGAPR